MVRMMEGPLSDNEDTERVQLDDYYIDDNDYIFDTPSPDTDTTMGVDS